MAAPRIRPVTPRDASIVGQVVVSMLADSPLAFGENLAEAQKRTDEEWLQLTEQLIAPPMRTAFLVYDGQSACGFVCADASFAEVLVDTVVISRLWVAPRQRGAGLGRRLMEAVTGWARHRHAGLVELGVTEMNASAMEFYKHLGYKDLGIRTPWPRDPSKQIIILGKELNT